MSGSIETIECDKLLEKIAVLEQENAKLRDDISAIKQGNQSIGRDDDLLQKFEKISNEFRDFAYIVSHDLKAPLRGIKTLACWIADDYSDKLDDEGKEQLDLLRSRVDRMESLIEGILQYSRIGRVTEEVMPVDIKAVIDDIVEMNVPKDSISFTIESDLPIIECEKTRIHELFQYIIGNAVKFMDKPQGRISVRCDAENNFWKFSISDNGPGIDPKHHEKIFRLFQTLKPKDEDESTGIGLTLAKKIVEVNGGMIRVESESGQGCTIVFTLPK